MHVLITGASGFIGSALRDHLSRQGHTVRALVRGRRVPGEAWWDPQAGAIDLSPAAPVEAVIHLAGENVAGGRWTHTRKARMTASRITGTDCLTRALATLSPKPSVLLAASAIGFYGARDENPVDETAPAGRGFLAGLSQAWEDAADPAREAGIRVVHPRIGMVLSPTGGALQRMLPVFRLGLGGPLGSGRQRISWITLDDLIAALAFMLQQPALAGPVNCVAPNAVTNREFTHALGRVLHRPVFVPAPAVVLRLLLGEMADALLLTGAHVIPQRLLECGFPFRHPILEPALRAMLESADA